MMRSRLPSWPWIASAVALRLWRTRRFARNDGLECEPPIAKTISPRLDASAEAHDEAEESRGPAVAIAVDELADARLDRIDQRRRLRAQRHDEVIEPREPAHLQQYVACHVELKGGDADAEHLGKHNRTACARPILVREQP